MATSGSCRYLFSGIRRQVEDEDREEGDADAGDDDVDGVEQRLAPQGQVEDDVLKLNGNSLVCQAMLSSYASSSALKTAT